MAVKASASVTIFYIDDDPFITGTQTAATGSWKGVAPFDTLTDGQKITYWLPYAGSGNATLNLTLSDGSTTGAKNCYYGGTTRLTTQYPAGSAIRLTYRSSVTIGSSTYTGWWGDANYDSGNTYDRIKYNGAVKAYSAITTSNIIVGTSSGFFHLKTGKAFDITYPILYAASIISSGSTGTNNYTVIPFTVTSTQSLTLTAYKSVYIKGKLSGTTFTPVSTTPLTQTIPTSDDGYHYMLLGTAYSTTAMYLLGDHPIFQYYNGAFKSTAEIAVDAAKVATNYMDFSDAGLVVGNLTSDTLGNNILIDSDSLDIRNGETILASYQANTIYLGLNSIKSVIDLCDGTATITNINEDTNYDWYRLLINSRDSIGLKTTGEITMDANADSGTGLSSSAVFRLSAHKPWVDYGGIDMGDGSHADFIIDYYDCCFLVDITNTWSSGANITNGRIEIDTEGLYIQHKETLSSGDTMLSNIVLEGGSMSLYADNTIYVDSHMTLRNATRLFGLTTDGEAYNAFELSASNNMAYGYGSYEYGANRTHIYGNDIRMFVKQANGTNYQPYYRAGNSVAVNWNGAGYVTNSGKDIYFTIPLAKPVIGSPTVTAASTDGFIFRQATNYTHGSSSSTRVKPTLVATLQGDGNFVQIKATPSATTNVSNNDVIGISAYIKITFS